MMLSAIAIGLLSLPKFMASLTQEAANVSGPLMCDVQTRSVGFDADDPSIWVHPTQPELSLIIGTNKATGPNGSLHVFDLSGRQLQVISGMYRPNNVDVQQGCLVGGAQMDLAIATERDRHRLRIFRVNPGSRKLVDVTGATSVFVGESGEHQEPMGVSIYCRPTDQATYAIVSRPSGPEDGYLWQYRLCKGSKGKVDLRKVRSFGHCKAGGEIESLAVDDVSGSVYAAEELYGVRKYAADPHSERRNDELGAFGLTGYEGDREGLGMYPTGPQSGYLVSCDQREGGSYMHIFRREGGPGGPNDHSQQIASIQIESDDTDGIEIVSQPLGPSFPEGILVAMNSKGKNFMIFDWRKMRARIPSSGAKGSVGGRSAARYR